MIENRENRKKTQALGVIESLTFELCIIFLPSDLMWQSAGVFLAILVIETLFTIVTVIIPSHLLMFCSFAYSNWRITGSSALLLCQIAPLNLQHVNKSLVPSDDSWAVTMWHNLWSRNVKQPPCAVHICTRRSLGSSCLVVLKHCLSSVRLGRRDRRLAQEKCSAFSIGRRTESKYWFVFHFFGSYGFSVRLLLWSNRRERLPRVRGMRTIYPCAVFAAPGDTGWFSRVRLHLKVLKDYICLIKGMRIFHFCWQWCVLQVHLYRLHTEFQGEVRTREAAVVSCATIRTLVSSHQIVVVIYLIFSENVHFQDNGDDLDDIQFVKAIAGPEPAGLLPLALAHCTFHRQKLVAIDGS